MPPRPDSLLESPLKFPDLGKSVFSSIVYRAIVWRVAFSSGLKPRQCRGFFTIWGMLNAFALGRVG